MSTPHADILCTSSYQTVSELLYVIGGRDAKQTATSTTNTFFFYSDDPPTITRSFRWTDQSWKNKGNRISAKNIHVRYTTIDSTARTSKVTPKWPTTPSLQSNPNYRPLLAILEFLDKMRTNEEACCFLRGQWSRQHSARLGPR